MISFFIGKLAVYLAFIPKGINAELSKLLKIVYFHTAIYFKHESFFVTDYKLYALGYF